MILLSICSQTLDAKHVHVIMHQRVFNPSRGLRSLISNREVEFYKTRALNGEFDRVSVPLK